VQFANSGVLQAVNTSGIKAAFVITSTGVFTIKAMANGTCRATGHGAGLSGI